MKRIMEMCKCGVHLTINNHRDYYQKIEEFVSEHSVEADDGVIEKIIETDTIVELQFYPHTPIGFYIVHHYDIDLAIAEALEILNDLS